MAAIRCRVRHEAGEALGAIGTPECFELLRAHQDDPCPEVAQTCQLALQRIQHYSAACAPTQPVPARSWQEETSCRCRAPEASAARQPAHDAGCTGMQPACRSCSDPPAACRTMSQMSGACQHTASQHAGPGGAASAEPDSSPYLSVDPAPAAALTTPTPTLRRVLLDESVPIFERYRCACGQRSRLQRMVARPACNASTRLCPPMVHGGVHESLQHTAL